MKNIRSLQKQFIIYTWILTAGWTIIVLLSLAVNISNEKEHIIIVSLGHFIIWALFMGGIVAGGKKLIQSDRMRRQTVEAMKNLNTDLSVLFRISSAISRTIDLDELFMRILKAITNIDILNIEPRGGIFIIEGERMKLVSHLGHPEAFLDMHKEMKIGDCLCGEAAETGEIIISSNCKNDPKHTINYPGMLPHGHLILPLKSKNRVVGVLYLYFQAGFELEKDRMDLFISIGNLIGMAIDNAMLYEEARQSSLQDPLTELANRRLMDIEFERNLAMANRFDQPFSVIMLDIDHFKKYNDTNGHTAGDKILIKVARIISKETRGIDLDVRYGGEEFLVLLPNTKLEQASDVAERIRMSIEAKTGVTVSLGVTEYHKKMHKDEIIATADNALYKAKQNGRNRIEVNG